MKQQGTRDGPTRILLVNHVGQIFGAENSMLSLLSQIDRERFEPALAAPGEGELRSAAREIDVPVKLMPPLRLHRTINPFSLLSQGVRLLWCRTILGGIVRDFRPHIIHANSLISGLEATTWRFGMPPVIYHARDLSFPPTVLEWVVTGSAAVVAISRSVREAVVEAVPDAADKTEVIYNGIDPEQFKPERPPDEVRATLGVAENAPLFGTVGQLVPWKRLDLFLQAAAQITEDLPEARFVIVGADLFGENTEYVKSLHETADELDISDSVIWAGYRDRVAELMNAMDVLIHTAEQEPLGRVILEAMAVGTPCVAVDSAGPAEIITDLENGRLVEACPEALAEAAILTVTRPRLAESFAAAGRERIRRDFDATTQARKMEELYLSVKSRRDTQGWGI